MIFPSAKVLLLIAGVVIETTGDSESSVAMVKLRDIQSDALPALSIDLTAKEYSPGGRSTLCCQFVLPVSVSERVAEIAPLPAAPRNELFAKLYHFAKEISRRASLTLLKPDSPVSAAVPAKLILPAAKVSLLIAGVVIETTGDSKSSVAMVKLRDFQSDALPSLSIDLTAKE